jgi:hypothetical protein
MKNFYFQLLFLVLPALCYGQDSLQTEIVFKTVNSANVKIYRIYDETQIIMTEYSHHHHNIQGTSFKKEYLLTAPGSIMLPKNFEGSFMMVDSKNSLSNAFTITADGKKQTWQLQPTGSKYKSGRATLWIGAGATLLSTALLMYAGYQSTSHQSDISSYESNLKIYNMNPTFFNNPGPPPKDHRIGYVIPSISVGISITAVIVGIRTMINNYPKATRIE